MPHELETLADGSTAFATARVPAWHQLGHVALGAMTAAELMKNAQLGGWNVRLGLGSAAVVPTGRCLECRRAEGAKHTQKCPVPNDADRESGQVVTAEDTATVIEAPGWYPILRTVPVSNDVQVLGMAGSPNYPIMQPEQVAEFGEALIDQSGAIWETGGSLRGGRDIFMTLQLPESIKIGGSDEVNLYLALMNNYSAQGTLRVVTTPVRVVCANTERAALRDHRSSYTFRHSSGMLAKVAEAREALKINFEWTEAFQAEAEAMINTKMSNDQFDKLVAAVWPEKFGKPHAEWRQPQTTQMETLQGLFRSAGTQENIRGTVWAGYQSVVEYLDWMVPVNGQTDQAEVDRIRATRSFDGAYDELKLTTFGLCRDLVAAA